MLLNLRQASKRFKIPVPTLREYIKESGIALTIYRGTLRVELKDLERIIKDRRGPKRKEMVRETLSAWITKALLQFLERLRQK